MARPPLESLRWRGWTVYGRWSRVARPASAKRGRAAAADGAASFTGRSRSRRGSPAAWRGSGADARDPAQAIGRYVPSGEVLGGLDAVVLNAGVLARRAAERDRATTPGTACGTNLVGPYRYALACLPAPARGRRPSIVIRRLRRRALGRGTVGAAYSVSKRGAVMLAKMLAVEAGPQGSVRTPSARATRSPAWSRASATLERDGSTEGLAAPAARPPGARRDVAAAVAFLVSSDGEMIRARAPDRRRHAGGAARARSGAR